MKTKIPWLLISLFLALSMLLSSCAPKASTGSNAYLTVNYEQISTWVRNFNPFSPDALGSAATAVYEPLMIYNKSIAQLVP